MVGTEKAGYMDTIEVDGENIRVELFSANVDKVGKGISQI